MVDDQFASQPTTPPNSWLRISLAEPRLLSLAPGDGVCYRCLVTLIPAEQAHAIGYRAPLIAWSFGVAGDYPLATALFTADKDTFSSYDYYLEKMVTIEVRSATAFYGYTMLSALLGHPIDLDTDVPRRLRAWAAELKAGWHLGPILDGA